MPKTGTEFLTLLLQKAGVKIDDDAIKAALAVPELATVQIPDALISHIDNGLLSIKDAKNNHSEIQGHYFKAFADGQDKNVKRIIEELKLPDEIRDAIMNEDSTAKRVIALTNRVREIEAAKAKAGGADKEALNLEITRLNNELRQEKEKEAGIRAEHLKEITQVRMNHSLGSLLGGYKTKFDELPAGVKESTLKAIINGSLTTDSAEITVDEAGQLILRKKDGTNFFGEDNRLLEPKSYLDKIFARDKILIVNDQNQNQNGSGNGARSHTNNGQQFQRQQQNNSANNGNGNANAANPVLASLANEALKVFETNGQQ